MRGKRGQYVFAGIMIFVMVFIGTVALIEPLKDMIGWSRNASNLDCGNSSISAGTKATCIIVDFVLPYFIGICIASGAAYVGARRFSRGED